MSTSSIPVFRVWSCGTFLVEQWKGKEWKALQGTDWGGSQEPRRLLKKLLCSPGRRTRRGEIQEHFWPNVDEQEANDYLNDAAYRLRAALRPAKGSASLFITSEKATSYTLSPQTLIWVDADAALDLLKQVEVIGHTNPASQFLLEEAMTYLNRGTFLEDEDSLWVYGRRGTLETARYRAQLWLAELYEQQGIAGQAEAIFCSLLEEDWTDEDTLCRLLKLWHEQGMHHQARRFYQRIETRFASEGLELTEQTKVFEQQLRSNMYVIGQQQSQIITISGRTTEITYTSDKVASSKESCDNMNRRTATKQIGTFIGNALIPYHNSLNEQPFSQLNITNGYKTRLTERSLSYIENLTREYWQLLPAISNMVSYDFLAFVCSHKQTLTSILRMEQTTIVQKRLYGILSEVDQIVGTMLYSMKRHTEAEKSFNFAVKSAEKANHHNLQAAALCRLGNFLIDIGKAEKSLAFLEAAENLASIDATPTIRAWIFASQADAYAHLHESKGCDTAIGKADDIATHIWPGQDFYYTLFDYSKLSGYKGACYVRLARPKDGSKAQEVLKDALTQLDSASFIKRSTLLRDLAIAYSLDAHVEEACKVADHALTIAEQANATMYIQRLYDFRQQYLKNWNDVAVVKRFDEHLQIVQQSLNMA